MAVFIPSNNRNIYKTTAGTYQDSSRYYISSKTAIIYA